MENQLAYGRGTSSLVESAHADAFATRFGKQLSRSAWQDELRQDTSTLPTTSEQGQAPNQTMKSCLLHHHAILLRFLETTSVITPSFEI